MSSGAGSATDRTIHNRSLTTVLLPQRVPHAASGVVAATVAACETILILTLLLTVVACSLDVHAKVGRVDVAVTPDEQSTKAGLRQEI